MIHPTQIRLFIKPGCPWCDEAIEWLTSHDISFATLNVSRDASARAEMLELVRTFTAKEITPVAGHFDHADEYPERIVEQMKEMGLFGITVPVEYGGLGLDLLTYVMVVEELSYGWMSVSGFLNTHFMGTFLIKTASSEPISTPSSSVGVATSVFMASPSPLN